MRNKLEGILERYPDVEFIKADGFDKAVIGVCVTEMRLIYSAQKCVKILKREMSETEAIEYFYANMEGFSNGGTQPIWMDDLTDYL